ncbi:MAG: peptide chain release factor 1, partial [Actinomycetota bacterium]
MRERLQEIENTYEELTRELSSPGVASDPSRLRELGRRHRELEEIVTAYREHRKAVADADDARTLAREERDPESEEFYRQEAAEASERARELEERLELLLLPKDPNDQKNVILEIRAGTGGQEAALFAGDLATMYRRYAERHRWKTEVLSSSPSDVGGFKDVVVEVKGDRAYSRLKHEAGTHRVQRVPETESQGRIHTSTATVAVLPEAEDVEVGIRPEDVQVDVFRSSGPGGQSVNTTDSAVRVTHKPSGIVIAVQ